MLPIQKQHLASLVTEALDHHDKTRLNLNTVFHMQRVRKLVMEAIKQAEEAHAPGIPLLHLALKNHDDVIALGRRSGKLHFEYTSSLLKQAQWTFCQWATMNEADAVLPDPLMESIRQANLRVMKEESGYELPKPLQIPNQSSVSATDTTKADESILDRFLKKPALELTEAEKLAEELLGPDVDAP